MKRFAWNASRTALCVVLLLSWASAASARLVPGPLSEEWVAQEAKPPLSSFYYLVKDGKIAAELRTVEEHIRIRLTPIAYLRLVQKNSLESAFENYRPGDTTGAVVAGKAAARHDFTFSVKNGNGLQGRVYCFLDGNTGFSVLFVALAQSFDVLEADLRAYLNGLRLDDGTSPTPSPTPADGFPTPTPWPELTIPDLPTVTPLPDRPTA